MYTPDNGIVKWKTAIKIAARQQWSGKALECPFQVHLRFVFPRPKSMVWKTKEMTSIRHTKKPDRDNLEKAVLDALTGIFWVDDCQVCAGPVEKWIAGGDEVEGVFVSILELKETVE